MNTETLIKRAYVSNIIANQLKDRQMKKQAVGHGMSTLATLLTGKSPKYLMDYEVGGSPVYEFGHGFAKGVQGHPHASNAYTYPLSGMGYTTGYGVGDTLRETRKFINNTTPRVLDDASRQLYNLVEPDPKKHVPTYKRWTR